MIRRLRDADRGDINTQLIVILSVITVIAFAAGALIADAMADALVGLRHDFRGP